MRLDPGLAFGTGASDHAHVPALDRAPCRPGAMAAGAGLRLRLRASLAIGAGLHGATGIDAVDIDPAAVGSQPRQCGSKRREPELVGLPDQAEGLYPVVLANILAAPLKLLAPLLSQHVAPGGSLVMAGPRAPDRGSAGGLRPGSRWKWQIVKAGSLLSGRRP